MIKQIPLALFFLFCALATQAQADYASIDALARSTRKNGYPSPEALAKALCKNLSTDRDKARILFTWLAHNMRYDFKALGQDGPKARSQKEFEEKLVKEAFRKGRGVCMDYALLYKAMADAVGLECAFINGHAKGSVRGGWASHAWNAVKIDGQWELLDVTWGSGYSDEDNKFHPIFQAGYFFTLPRIFALDHFPEEEKWQLLDQPVDKKAFKNQASFSYSDPAKDIMDTEPFGQPLTKDADGKVILRLKIQQPPSILKLKMGKRDLEVERTDQDGWTTLRFAAANGRELQVWGGEKKGQHTITSLMGIFYIK